MRKHRIGLSIVSMVLVLCLLAGGTMAWFTDTEKVGAGFTAGVLDIRVEPGEDTTLPLTFENLRPMQYDAFLAEINAAGNGNETTEGFAPAPVYFQPVVVRNDGTLPVYIELSVEALDMSQEACLEGGEEKIVLDSGSVTWDQDGKDGSCTNGLADVLQLVLFESNGSGWNVVSSNLNLAAQGEPYAPGVVLPAGSGQKEYVIGAYLPETVDNAYQGKHFHGNLVAKAFQTDEGAGAPEEEDGRVTVQWVVQGRNKVVGSYKTEVVFPEGQETVLLVADQSQLPKDCLLVAGESYEATVTKGDKTVSFLVNRPGDGSGSDEENPIWIEDGEDLDRVREGLDKNYKLGGDIDLSAYENWEPIGTNSSFRGSLDGNGYAVTGLAINRSDAQEVGLFGHGLLCSVKDLTIREPDISGGIGSTGALFGILSSGEVTGCSVTGGYVKGSSYTGALFGTLSSGEVTDCSVTGGHVKGSGYTGGLTGRAVNSALENCYASAAVAVETPQDTVYAGGFVGYLGGPSTVKGSTASGEVRLEGSVSDAYLGGFAGNIIGRPTVTNNAATGNVINNGSGGTVFAGGFVGNVNASAVTGNTASGGVTNNGHVSELYLGGAVGYISGGVTIGESSATGNVTNNGAVDEFAYLGGFAGTILSIAQSANGLSAEGDVTNTAQASTLYLGGLLGFIGAGSSMSEGSATGSVTNQGEIETGYIGGLIGDTSQTSHVGQVSATGDVKNSGGATALYLGGITGSVDGMSEVSSASATGNVTNQGEIGTGYIGGVAGRLPQRASAQQVSAAGDVENSGRAATLYLGGVTGEISGSSGAGGASITGNVTNRGEIGTGYIGGLIGYTTQFSNIQRSYVTGAVANKPSAGTCAVGGLMGRVDYGAGANNCYASGSVENASTAAGSSAGGLVGDLSTGGSLRTSYTVSAVYGQSVDNAHPAVGIRVQGATADGLYFLDGKFYIGGEAAGYSGREGGMAAKTEDEMKTAATYQGWDSSVWNLADGAYPTLK